MNVEKINQLKEAMGKEIGKAIQNYNLDLGEFFTNKELANKALSVEIKLDLDQVRNEDFIKDEELRDSLRALPDDKLTTNALCLCERLQELVSCSLIGQLNC